MEASATGESVDHGACGGDGDGDAVQEGALTAGELSSKTAHRLLQSVGEEALAEERERWESQFERGEDVSEGRHRTDLYTEADGVWIHLQREKRRHHEVKSCHSLSGLATPGDRYELGPEGVCAWRRCGAVLGGCARQYALDEVQLPVVGGDGANWIRRGERSSAVPCSNWTASTCLEPRLWQEARPSMTRCSGSQEYARLMS